MKQKQNKIPVIWLELARPNKNHDQEAAAKKLVLATSTYRRTIAEAFADELFATAKDACDQQLILRRIEQVIREVLELRASEILAERTEKIRRCWTSIEARERTGGGLKRESWNVPETGVQAAKKATNEN